MFSVFGSKSKFSSFFASQAKTRCFLGGHLVLQVRLQASKDQLVQLPGPQRNAYVTKNLQKTFLWGSWYLVIKKLRADELFLLKP